MKKGIALILAILLCLSLLAGCGSKTAKIDLTDYAEVQFRGKDGEGTARADFDYSGFEKAVMEKLGSGDAILQKLVQFESALEVSVSPDKGLKNGDTVTLTAVCGSDAAKALGIALGETARTVTVEGLTVSTPAPAVTATPAPASTGNLTPGEEEPGEEDGLLDPFDPAYWNKADGIEIRYSGASPYGYLDAVNHLPADNPLSRISYGFSEQRKVHEGDKITVTASLPADMAKEYTLKSTECEFEIGPVNHYLTDVNELDKAAVSALKSEAEGLAEEFAAGTLEFRDEKDWTGFYNGETVTVNSCTPGKKVYAVNNRDGYIQALLIPCYLNVTVADPDWMDDPQTREFDLVVLCAADGLLVDADGSVSWNRAERVQTGIKDLEKALAKDQLTWYENATMEKVSLPK